MNEPIHIEVTSHEGASKWITNVVSHTEEEVQEAKKAKDSIVLEDSDGAKTQVDFVDVFTLRVQSDEVYKSRKNNGR